MFQETVYNTGNSNVLTVRLIRDQTTDTTDNQINLYSRLTGPIKFINHGSILQCIHFKNNASFPSF